MRNALIPVITVIGLQVGVLFTGAILTETIFSWPGVGKWLIEAIGRRDYPVLQGGMLLLGGMVMIGQPAGGRDLRHHQPPHPALKARTMTTLDRQPRCPDRATAPACASSGAISAANKGAVGGLVIVVLVLLMAPFAPWIAPYAPDLTDPSVFLNRRPGRPGAPAPTGWAPTPLAATSCRA